MAEKLTTLLHDFDLISDNRSKVTFVNNIRMDPSQRHGAGAVTLKGDANGLFPTSGDNYIITPLFNPAAVRQWIGFQSYLDQVNDGPDVQLTGDGYRLSDGTQQWWWNGSAWVVDTTHWNTEGDIASHIATFAATARQIAIVANLTTTSTSATPVLRMLRVAWVGKVEVFEDLLYRSLVPLLQTVRTISDFAIKVPMPGGAQLDIGKAVTSTKLSFNVVDVESVFNDNIDPNHYNNILQSYNPTTKIATLNPAIPVGQFAFCRLVLQPQVSVVSTSQDFIEVEAVPALQITNVQSVDSTSLSVDNSCTNKATGAQLIVQAPYRFNLRFTMIALAPGGVDLARLLRALVNLVENNFTIMSKQTGEEYRFWMIDEFNTMTVPMSNNLQSMQVTFDIIDVLTYERPTLQATAVKTLNLNT